MEVRLRDKPQLDDKQGGEERKILDRGPTGSYVFTRTPTTLYRSRLIGNRTIRPELPHREIRHFTSHIARGKFHASAQRIAGLYFIISNSAGHYAACRLKILGASTANYLRTLTKQFPPT